MAQTLAPRAPVEAITRIAFLVRVVPLPERRRAGIEHSAEDTLETIEKRLIVSCADEGDKLPAEDVRRTDKREPICGQFVADARGSLACGDA